MNVKSRMIIIMILGVMLALSGSSTLVVFYKNFSSSYSYTRIGKVNQPDKLADRLGQDNVQVEFSLN